ncbi:hypothetical protein [Cloacibacillus porcorum]|uniref:hypothetical protein n=1 Tax=Cloacibacillus porcorum TaxID=1197717 RepID=UPI003F0BC773
MENEIESLPNTLTGANAVLPAYANSKIEELDAKRQQLMKSISDLTAEGVSPEQANRISGYLDKWEHISFNDRRQVVDGLISCIEIIPDSV